MGPPLRPVVLASLPESFPGGPLPMCGGGLARSGPKDSCIPHPWEHCVPSPALAVVSGLELWAVDQLAACSQPVHGWPSGTLLCHPWSWVGSSEMPPPPALLLFPISGILGCG